MEQDLACGLEEMLSCNAFMAVLGESSAVHKVRVQCSEWVMCSGFRALVVVAKVPDLRSEC